MNKTPRIFDSEELDNCSSFDDLNKLIKKDLEDLVNDPTASEHNRNVAKLILNREENKND